MFTVYQSSKKTWIPVRELYLLIESYKLKLPLHYHMWKKVMYLDNNDIEIAKSLYFNKKPNEPNKQNN